MRAVAKNVVPFPRRARRAKLSDAVVAQLRVGERCYDDTIPGYFAWRGKRGVVFKVIADLPTWAAKMRGHATVERVVGRYPETTCKAARTAAGKMVVDIKSGRLPEEPSAADGPTLEAAWQGLRDIIALDAEPRTLTFYDSAFKRMPWPPGTPLAVITDPAHLPAVEKKFSRLDVKRPSTRHTWDLLLRIVERAKIKYPTLHLLPKGLVAFPTDKKKAKRAESAMEADELPGWWREAQKLEPIKREFVLFLLLSGLRAESCMVAKWEHVDEAAHKLHVPRPKGGTSRNFDLPLSEEMLACLKRAKVAFPVESEWLFPSVRSKTGHIADARAQYTDAKGLVRNVTTGHMLRHAFTNMATLAGLDEAEVGRILNHKSKTQTGRYGNRRGKFPVDLENMRKVSKLIMESLGK